MKLCLPGKLLPLIAGALFLPLVVAQTLVRDVRADIGKSDFTAAEARVGKYRASSGVTSEMLEALSWLGRGALAAKQLDRAEAYAAQTHKLALEMLKSRRLDADGNLPIALGAAIEVEAQVAAARGERSAAIEFLSRELGTYRDTSIRTRIQKNIHLLSLEGKPAPELEKREWLGPKPTGLVGLKGRLVLLFFWAHWCGDCKSQAPILVRLNREYGSRGLVLVGPTARYGYTARGQDATPAEELKYIAEIRARYYADLPEMPVPVSEETFKNYGVSTTPTLVLIARGGLVLLYHPGQMSFEDLAPIIEAALKK
jgi:thiol-disulfide isomerase/thioredoxin